MGGKPGRRPRYSRGDPGARNHRRRPMGPDQPAAEYDPLRFGGPCDAPALASGTQELSTQLFGRGDTPADAPIHPGKNKRWILVAARQPDGPLVPRLP